MCVKRQFEQMMEEGEGHGMLYRTINQAMKLEELVLNPPPPCAKQIIIFYGDSETGKSTEALNRWPDAYRMPVNLKNDNMFFQYYRGHESMVIDEFARLAANGMVVHTKWPKEVLNDLTEKSPGIINIKGRGSYSYIKTFVLTSQVAPNVWFPETVVNNDQMHAWARRITAAYHFKSTRKARNPDDVPNCRKITLTHGSDVLGLGLVSDNSLFPDFHLGNYRVASQPAAAPPPPAPAPSKPAPPKSGPRLKRVPYKKSAGVVFPMSAVTNPL